MAPKALPSQAELLQLLRYDPESGKLYWLERAGSPRWNSRFAGQQAFVTAHAKGYRYSSINDVKHLAHRVIWKMVHGVDPDQIDHINGDKADNSIANLRSVDDATNKRNTSKPSSNTSGHVGVSWDASRQKWMAFLKVRGRFVNLGRFDTLEEALAARTAANEQHEFHENHGR